MTTQTAVARSEQVVRTSLSPKICLVTGGTGALGEAMAAGLLMRGHRVVLMVRDKGKGEVSAAKIAGGGEKPELLIADLSDPELVRRAADTFKRTHGVLHVLINNAAVFTQNRRVTAGGLEMMFATNHLGPFLLTNLLLDHLKNGSPARIVTISAPSTTKLNFNDLQSEVSFKAFRAFGASKMANILFTYELARRLEGTGVTANVVHPGLIRSGLMREAPKMITALLNPASKPPTKAAQLPIRVAVDPQYDGLTGKFFRGSKTWKSSEYSYDRSVQERLWNESEKLVAT